MAKILLVEDDKSLREIYGVRLQAEGYEIVSAGDGEEALALAIKERPNLIVSDVMMPKISGFDMLDILRSTTETKDVKIIMMTALSSEDQRARGESLGADRYLVKSQVGIEDVVRTVHEVLGDSTMPAGSPAGSVAPAPMPTPTPTVVEPDPEETAITPTVPAPMPAEVASSPAPAMPTPSPAPTPVTPIVNSVPEPAAAPVAPPAPAPIVNAPPAPVELASPNALPQPTAPFTSPAPASLGDQVRDLSTVEPPVFDSNPTPAPTNAPLDLSAQMAAELGTPVATPAQTPAAAPVAQAPAQPGATPPAAS